MFVGSFEDVLETCLEMLIETSFEHLFRAFGDFFGDILEILLGAFWRPHLRSIGDFKKPTHHDISD